MADVRVQSTPNPNAIKITVDRKLTDGKSKSYGSAGAAAADPVASKIFAVEGVQSVFVLNDFITVTKSAGTDWQQVADQVRAAVEAALA
jgi:hypothetical protein